MNIKDQKDTPTKEWVKEDFPEEGPLKLNFEIQKKSNNNKK